MLGADNALTWGDASGLTENSEVVFLGLDGEAPLFAPIPAAGDTRPAYEQRPAWDALSLLPPRDLAVYGGARSLVDWHARHRFCANCGSPTQIAKGGWQRNCDACGAQHFPRTDPVAIMLVEHEGDLLLGRGTRFPERRYSALGGLYRAGRERRTGRGARSAGGGRRRRFRCRLRCQPALAVPEPADARLPWHGAGTRTHYRRGPKSPMRRWFTRAEVATAMDVQVAGEDKAFPSPAAHGYCLASSQLVAGARLMADEITVDVWSDVVCPWCAIGAAQFLSAVESLKGEVDVTIRYMPFELNPDMAPEGHNQIDLLAKAYNKTPADVLQMRRHVEQAGEEAGFPMTWQGKGEEPVLMVLEQPRCTQAAALGADRGRTGAAGGAQAGAVSRLFPAAPEHFGSRGAARSGRSGRL